MSELNKMTVNGISLYFGRDIPYDDKLSYLLPPKPPEGASDVRFKDGWRLVKDSGEIEVMSNTENITIAYDIKIDACEYHNWILTSEGGNEYLLESRGEITVPSANKFTLGKKTIIPINYTLHQNYPNPFNPFTSLRYDLPEDNFVTLTVYDMLGRKITQLVNTSQEAGFKSVQWNSTNSFGKPISAGVYFYQIQAGGFVETKKMVLLK